LAFVGPYDVGLAETLGLLLPHLDERRRLVLGAAARVYGHRGIRLMAGVAGAAESTVARGLRELERGGESDGRVRSAGAGRKRLRDLDPELVPELLALVGPDERGDPESPLRWTVKSTRALAVELSRQGVGSGMTPWPGAVTLAERVG
jgi:Rhodopirellula transposase DDE domain